MTGDERGASMTVAVAVLLPCLILAGGLAVDGAQQARAARQAHAVAAAAARAGCDEASAAQLVGRRDPVAARARALEAARSASAEGARLSASVGVGAQRLTVSVRATRATIVLSMIGLQEVSGRATVGCTLTPR